MTKFTVPAISGLLLISATAAAEPSRVIMVGNFAEGDKSGWEEQEFKGKTSYTITPGKKGNQSLHVRSTASASGLHKRVTIDLAKTPYLNWSWKVGNTLKGVDETTKKGDDYPIRIYVVLSGGLFFWKTQALNYVWSSSDRPRDDSWTNAYTEHVKMVAVDSGGGNVGSWVAHKRNVREDFKRHLGKDIDHIDAVAIMADTDNSGQSATANVGNVFFSSE